MNTDRIIGQLQAVLKKLASRRHVRHAVIGVETGDSSLRWIESTGMATLDGTPLQENTPYLIASVTKLYIASAVLKLHEQGVVQLDSSISDYLPGSMTGGLHTLNGTDFTADITIRNLLSHTTGLPDWLEDRPPGGKSIVEQLDDEEDRLITVQDAITYVRENLIPHFPPQPMDGSPQKVRYSDTNFQLLIAILEARMKMPVHLVFEELIYQPLGLHHTFHPGQQPPDAIPKPAAVWLGDQPFTKPLLLKSFRDLYSTADEQLKFLRALIRGELFQDPGTAALMQRHWNRFGFPRDVASLRQPGWPIEYGLGMMRFRLPRLFTPFNPMPAVVGHSGSTGSWLFYCPHHDLYLCGNVSQATAGALPYKFIPKLIQLLDSVN